MSADVALDAREPLVGSFTEGGLTYAVGADGLALAAVDPAAVGEGGILSIPESVAFNGTAYPVTAVGAFAFYLSGATGVALPASVASVDERAFRSSDVERVEVADGNPDFASFDGALYSADLTRLLLIPGGRQGAVRIDPHAEEVPPSAFSHCAGVTAISADAGGAAYSSWEGSLYDASGDTLLRVPAGAAEITIRDGCTAIAAGALEGCAKLERINAPASVASISPDVFTPIPTVSLPAMAVSQDESDGSVGAEGEAEVPPRRVIIESQGLDASDVLPDLGSTPASPSPEAGGSNKALQLIATVALSTTDDCAPEINPAFIEVALPDGADAAIWHAKGFVAKASAEDAVLEIGASIVDIQEKSGYAAKSAHDMYVYFNGTLYAHRNGFPGMVDHTWTSSPAKLINVSSGLYTAAYSPWVRFDGAAPTGLNGDSTKYLSISPSGYPYFNPTYYACGIQHSAGTHMNDHCCALGIGRGPGTVIALCENDFVTLSFEGEGGSVYGDNDSPTSSMQLQARKPCSVYEGDKVTIPEAKRSGYRFLGWMEDSGQTNRDLLSGGSVVVPAASCTYRAQWERVEFDVGFDVDSEPGDEDYPGEAKPDETVNVSAGAVAIEDPKRPGYVFQGWAIPNADGTEAVDQELVYQGDDGKWYVDASKLPDYAGDDGRVELTARWTSVISVDVPQSVTFYADTVTQNQGSREGAASSAFGQNKVANQSEVDLRVVGLESSAVETTDTTLGADSILKKAEAATPSTSAGKLLSLYPSSKRWTADELQDPEAVGGTKDAAAVDFDLDDILLEKSFPSDSFAIPAGGTLNMGYRLNLSETGQQLDYDKLSTLEDGQSAAIANVSYCFAADYGPVFWTTDDDGSTLELAAIKADADKIAAGDAVTTAKYTRWMNDDHRFHVKWYDQGVSEFDNPTAATVYDVRIIGVNHDDKSDDSGKAGITFQFVDLLKDPHQYNYPMCNTLDHIGRTQNSFTHKGQYETYDTFDTFWGSAWEHNTNTGGWGKSLLRARMNAGVQAEGLNTASAGRDSDDIWQQVPMDLAEGIERVGKKYYDGPIGVEEMNAQVRVANDKLFIASYSELVGMDYFPSWDKQANEGEAYPYWEQQRTKGDVANSTLVRRQTFADGSVGSVGWYWWLRSCSPPFATAFAAVSSTGIPASGSVASNALGIAPCFCL